MWCSLGGRQESEFRQHRQLESVCMRNLNEQTHRQGQAGSTHFNQLYTTWPQDHISVSFLCLPTPHRANPPSCERSFSPWRNPLWHSEPFRKLSEILNLVLKSGGREGEGEGRGIRGPCCHPYSCPIMHRDVRSHNRYSLFTKHTDLIW